MNSCGTLSPSDDLYTIYSPPELAAMEAVRAILSVTQNRRISKLSPDHNHTPTICHLSFVENALIEPLLYDTPFSQTLCNYQLSVAST